MNDNVGVISLLLNSTLVCVTSYYAYLTYRLTKNADRTIENSNREYDEKQKLEIQLNENLLNVLSHEIFMNYTYICLLLYYLKFLNFNANEIEKLFIGSNEEISTKAWNSLNELGIQNINHNILSEIIMNYTATDQLKKHITMQLLFNTVSKDYVNKKGDYDNTVELCKSVLYSSKKSLKLIPNFKQQLVLEFEGKKLIINDETGDLEELK